MAEIVDHVWFLDEDGQNACCKYNLSRGGLFLHWYDTGLKKVQNRVRHYGENYIVHCNFDTPAIVSHDFDKKSVKHEYYRNGLLHRNNGPAIIIKFDNYQHQSEEWYQHGNLHRLDGPAIIDANPTEKFWIGYWYVNGKKLDLYKWFDENNFPPWPNWTAKEKTFFKLKFG